MGLLDEHDDDPQIVNIFDFYKLHGLADQTVYQLVLHCLLTRSFALEADARAAALELGIVIPYVFPDNGQMH